MKLVLSVEALTPPLTGIGRYAWELAQRLPLAQGVKSVRFYRGGRWVADPSTLLAPEASQPRKRKKRLIKWSPEAVTFWRGVECRGRVFHGPNYMLPACADKAVVTVHDLSIFKYRETHPADRLRHFDREFEASLGRAAHVITDSQAVRGEFLAHFGWAPEKVTVVPLGVAPVYAPRDNSANSAVLARHGLQADSYVLCVSTMEPRKNIGRLLQAYMALPDNVRRRRPLVLVGGKGWLSDQLHADIVRGEAEGWLRYLGFVPEADLPEFYAGASLFVYPSSYEGFGLPVLEAMASGVPVITSNRSCLPEVAGDAGLLVDPDDVDALAAALRRGIEDDAWRRHARARGLELAAGYSWDKCVAETCDVYRRVA